MANSNAPSGFSPVNGNPQVHMYYKSAAVQLGIGDPVVRAADSADPKGYAAVTRATTGSYVTGVVVGIVVDSTRTYPYLKSGDSGYVLVADGPNEEFHVLDNGGASGLVVTQIGQHINSVAAIDCNTTSGRSKYALDTEAVATNNTWLVVRKDDKPGNDVGAYCRWIVKPNLHTEVNAGVTNLKEI